MHALRLTTSAAAWLLWTETKPIIGSVMHTYVPAAMYTFKAEL